MSNWITAKKLLETRAKMLQEANEIAGGAETEKRVMTGPENGIYEHLIRQAQELSKQVTVMQSGLPKTATAAEMRTAIAAGVMDGIGDSRSHDDDNEVRALRKDESAVSYLESRGADFSAGKINVGGFIRAALGFARSDEERALVGRGDSVGGFDLPLYTSANALDEIRNESAVIRAGAQVISMADQCRSVFARTVVEPVPGWRAEGAAVVQTEGVYERVPYAPKTLVGVVKVSRELLEDTVSSDQSITQLVTTAMSNELDRAALVGTGGTQPLGIKNTPGVLTVAALAPLTSYDPFVGLGFEIESRGGRLGAVLLNPADNATVARFKDTTGQPLRRPDMLQPVPFISTPGLAGTPEIIGGDYSKLLVPVTTGLRIEVLRERFADSFSYGILVYMRLDTLVSRPKSFCRMVIA